MRLGEVQGNSLWTHPRTVFSLLLLPLSLRFMYTCGEPVTRPSSVCKGRKVVIYLFIIYGKSLIFSIKNINPLMRTLVKDVILEK